jgi:hypothetical protein
MRRLSKVIALGAALAATAGVAFAVDTLLPLNITIVKPGSLAKFVAKPGLVSLPGTTNPTVAGATLRLKDSGGAAGTNTYTLPQINWKGLGNPPGSKGFKYKGTKTPGDPCVVVIVKTNVIKAVCKGTDITLTPPFSGTEGITLHMVGSGDNYCAVAGGTIVKNDATQFKAKQVPAPASCASPSGAFLD